MNTRRLSVLLLGAWLACTLLMTWVAVYNSESAELTLKHPSDRIQREMRDIGLERTRTLLHFHSAELSRHFFVYWEMTQFGLGAALAITLLFATNGNRLTMALSTAMIVIVVIQHFTMTPQILELGRGFDFASPDEMIDERRSFAAYQSFYSAGEILKWVLGAALAGRMLLSDGSASRRRIRRKIDVINDADYGHVDR